jgi:hypothetical protein
MTWEPKNKLDDEDVDVSDDDDKDRDDEKLGELCSFTRDEQSRALAIESESAVAAPSGGGTLTTQWRSASREVQIANMSIRLVLQIYNTKCMSTQI